MRIGLRIVLLLAIALAVGGAATLFINAVAFQNAPYPTWHSYNEALLAELEVSREDVIKHVRKNPEILFDTPGDTTSRNGVSIDEASRRVQEQAIRRTVERSRNLTALAIVAVTAGALVAGGVLARRILRPVRWMTEQARTASGVEPGVRLALDGPNDEIK